VVCGVSVEAQSVDVPAVAAVDVGGYGLVRQDGVGPVFFENSEKFQDPRATFTFSAFF
jgi:hypothetical protein